MTDKALLSLYSYCKNENYKGWDNFDGLNSKIFNKSPLYRFSLLRLAWIQFFKRSPINFRKIMLVPKGYNPKGIALYVSGLAFSGKIDEAKLLIDCLKQMVCTNYTRSCWGYNFDWQGRGFFTPVGTPNIVTTVFVGNALLDYFDNTKDNEYLDMAIGGSQFLLENLILFEDKNTLCFGYMPGVNSRVHNVNMLGSAFLARLYQLTKNPKYYEKSKKAMTYAVNALNEDFSWPYREDKSGQFIDNFHTGFNLISLNSWMECTGEYIWEEQLKNAYDYFLDTFWLDSGCPKYYHNALYPIDIHASAQGIVTCLKLAKYDKRSIYLTRKIVTWVIDNMQDHRGYFYYQKTRWYTNKISYIRWSQAWMFYALSMLHSQGLDGNNRD